jgi:HEPN domain-containing protein
MNPPRKGRIPASPEEWLLHAQSDLKLAKLGLNQDVLPGQICFHAQQAVEKAVKAVLLFNKVDFPLTHDLEELLDTLEIAGIPVPSELSDVGALTPYAVETRYPGYWGEISENDVSEAVSLAEKAIDWANESIR